MRALTLAAVIEVERKREAEEEARRKAAEQEAKAEIQAALLAPPPEDAVRISEKEILKNEKLRRKINEYYDKNSVERHRLYGYPFQFDRIIDLQVIEISGNRAQLDLHYIANTGSHETKLGRMTVTVERAGSTFRVLEMQTPREN